MLFTNKELLFERETSNFLAILLFFLTVDSVSGGYWTSTTGITTNNNW